MSVPRSGLIKSMIEHLIVHAAEAAAAFLDTVEVRETLGENGIT